jgi:ribosomal protein L37AE/L43A
MPRYDIQFQKGLSLRKFLARYGSEAQCIEAVCMARWPHGFECPECGSSRHCRLARGLFQCQDCRKQTSPTAGTLFQGTKLPLTVWFQAMHLLTQGKHSVSALELKRQLGVHYETAWAIKHKLMQAMLERESGTVLSGRIEVDDAYMGGARHGAKPGRGAPGKTPFVVAVQTDPERPASVLRMRMKVLRDVSRRSLQAWFVRGFVQGATVLTDGWSAYKFLEGDGFKHEPHVMPRGWRSARHPAFPWVNTILGNLKGNIAGVTRWVGKAHLNRYLAEFQYRFNRRFDLESILPRLLHAAVGTTAMPQPLLKLAWMCQAV